MEKITLVRTCWACPEQYDARDENKKLVGYLRLRHGRFQVNCPDVCGTTVYIAFPKGDGIFDHEERELYLKEAIKEIQKFHKLEITGEYDLNDEWKNDDSK